MPDTILSILHMITHLSLTISLQSMFYYHLHFVSYKTVVQKLSELFKIIKTEVVELEFELGKNSSKA